MFWRSLLQSTNQSYKSQVLKTLKLIFYKVFLFLDRLGSQDNTEYFCSFAKVSHPSLLIDLKLKGHLHRYKLHQIF